ncbi:MAG: DUF1272 domain-containing protein [Candidatus Acidiferrales bacterium]
MPLEMRAACEKYRESLAHDAEASICSFECAYCTRRAAVMYHVCPNYSGEHLRRPRRARKASA